MVLNVSEISEHLKFLDISVLIKTFVAVFVLADALGNAPIFLILTKGMEPEQKNSVVDRASIVATGVLLVFAFGGQVILKYLDISMGSLRVAGGLLLLLIALKMLEGHLDTPNVNQERDIAITPLALPLLAGPGTLTAVMLLMSESPNAHISVAVGIFAAMVVTWFIVRQAARIDHLIGAEGEVIITQLLGFLLAALAVEIASTGVRELFLIS
ncbi:MAG: MarC family protein [Aphanothece sp. CMT-3BRIN-NPC111]|jgi:multiple antibiotic resistance protein|nr:MarC family protein [Aphanothece sp. CMT-3BRIN-NPC111]